MPSANVPKLSSVLLPCIFSSNSVSNDPVVWISLRLNAVPLVNSCAGVSCNDEPVSEAAPFSCRPVAPEKFG